MYRVIENMIAEESETDAMKDRKPRCKRCKGEMQAVEVGAWRIKTIGMICHDCEADQYGSILY